MAALAPIDHGSTERRLCNAHGHAFISSYLANRPANANAGENESDYALCSVALLSFDRKKGLQNVYLWQARGFLVISIGYCEASILYHQLKGTFVSRPPTHAMMASLLGALSTTLNDVRIERYDDEGRFYYASLRLRQAEQLKVVDIRPSDAISLALCAQQPILVAKSLLLPLPSGEYGSH
jgi:bifunctional DNase/RNase